LKNSFNKRKNKSKERGSNWKKLNNINFEWIWNWKPYKINKRIGEKNQKKRTEMKKKNMWEIIIESLNLKKKQNLYKKNENEIRNQKIDD